MRANRLALPVLLLLVCVGCSDSDLQKVGKGLTATAQAIGTLQTSAIEANKLGILDDDDTRSILELCIQVDLAGKDAVAITRAISKLDQPSRAQILEILKPVIAAVGNMLDTGLLRIKNENSKQELRLILLGLQTTLNGIQIALAGG